jgi:hypothetical protein
MQPTQHGAFGSDPSNFVRCLPRQPEQHSKGDLARLALDMQADHDSLDFGPDAEENLCVPAGYTYFGQFVDHDLTFDTTSTFDGRHAPTNQRTPRFDLDCVYGRGPVDSPEMYDATGVFLKLGDEFANVPGRRDLLRDPATGRAVIGDPRNDENSIVSQIQAGFIRFHNAVASRLAAARGLAGPALFDAARNEVRWTYQRILVEDYLPRIVAAPVRDAFDEARRPDARGRSTDEAAFKLYVPLNRQAMALEFSGAAYRFGHSMVRNGYSLQGDRLFPIFDGAMDDQSLIGFQPLPANHVITDWRRFFPDSSIESGADGDTFSPAPGTRAGAGGANVSAPDAPNAPRLQFAYRIDTSVANPLAALPAAVASDPPPSLIVRNLWRGAAFELPAGQDFEAKLGVVLDPKYLAVRQQIAGRQDKTFRYVPVDQAFQVRTPLWFYILAEAQKNLVDAFGAGEFTEDPMLQSAAATATQLGPVGGRIVLEVFHGLLDSDEDSVRNHPDAAAWQPLVQRLRVWDVLTFA